MLIGDFFYTHRLTARDNGFLILFTDKRIKPLHNLDSAVQRPVKNKKKKKLISQKDLPSKPTTLGTSDKPRTPENILKAHKVVAV